MGKFTTNQIRNICLLSHGGVGKTTFLEAMLYNAKVVDRMGKVTDGSTVGDFDDEEIKRKVTIYAKVATIECNDVKINIIDTPGYFDFVGDVLQGLRASDVALILVSARSGVAVGTENSWEYAKNYNLPASFFINEMDHAEAKFDSTLDALIAQFGTKVAPFQYPIVSGGKFIGFVDIPQNKAYKFDGAKAIPCDIPDDIADQTERMRQVLIEAIAETDEELMDKFFSGEEFTDDEIQTALKKGFKDGEIVPVFCGSAFFNLGISTMAEQIAKYFPSPDVVTPLEAFKPHTEESVAVKVDVAEPFSALCFKTIADPFVGKLTLFKVISGVLKPDSQIFNASKDVQEKVGRLLVVRGKKQFETEELIAGDIGAVAKLNATTTGDTLCAPSRPVQFKPIAFPAPSLSLAIIPKAKGDEEKIGNGLQKILEEDPTFKTEMNVETHQTLIKGIGEQHLDVVVSKLKNKYGVSVDLIEPRVPYREAIRKKVTVEGKHKKQSGGHGQYGHVKMEFEPGETAELTFEERVFGGSVPRNYFPAVEKGLQECITKGVLAGYPVVNLKATLIDGSYHPVDSSEMAFKLAASIAYKEGLKQASPVLLEPIGHLEVNIPESNMGDVIGDINKRRGRILGMNPIGNGQGEVIAEVPLAEMFKYATDLRSMTQGRGKFTLEFERYEDAPANVAQKVIEKQKAE